MRPFVFLAIAIATFAGDGINPVLRYDSRCEIRKEMELRGPVGQKINIGVVIIERCAFPEVKHFLEDGSEIVQRDGWVLVVKGS